MLSLGIVPLGLRSRDTAPFALGIPPLSGPLGRLRNSLLIWTTDRLVFADLQRDAARIAREATGHELPTPAMNYPALADAIVQFSVPEFEYPRSDLATPVHFVGPVSLAAASPDMAVPDWWGDLDGSRPVVHVTQGTVANTSLDDLVLPTLRALADRDVLVVASTGGRDLPAAAIPANARVAPYLPYDRLFPHLSAFVTNGGYGGVHYALAHGVPILATGNTEDKSEVSARVAWSGAGLRLRPRKGSGGRIDERAIVRAVDRLLAEPSFRAHAASIGAAVTAAPGPRRHRGGAAGGDLLLPGDDGWDDARRAWQLTVDQNPTAIAIPADVDDVAIVVTAARRFGLRVAPQSTGHAAGALRSLDDTILLRTSRLRDVDIDPAVGPPGSAPERYGGTSLPRRPCTTSPRSQAWPPRWASGREG
ncbi:nucleotide disphospho-sugar-binding domain-containing protein [Microbacterium aurum]